jgi:hypothetical protein
MFRAFFCLADLLDDYNCRKRGAAELHRVKLVHTVPGSP